MKKLSLEVNGQTVSGYVQKVKGELWVHLNGKTFNYKPKDEFFEGAGGGSEDITQIKAPMPGKIIKINAQKGEAYSDGDIIVVMEAMKMEYNLKAAAEVRVEDILCQEGDQVTLGQTLIQFGALMAKVTLVEMGLRDGLQNEVVHLSQSQRFRFMKKLVDAGHKRIEIGAFVSPKWVPQMSETGKLVKKSLLAQKKRSIPANVRFSTLVPNKRGLDDALESGVKEIAIFGAVSETFSQKNINRSINESFKNFSQVAREAKKNKIRVRGYLSTVFGCPYEGRVSEKKVLNLIEKYMALGVYEISLGDTIGVATPKQVRSLLKKCSRLTVKSKVAMHFHDTRGTAIANILASLDLGYRTFDTSIGGLGGCPYAPGAAGNVATEDVVYMLHGMGFQTGLNLEKLIKTTLWMGKQVGRPLPSKLSLTGSKGL